MQDLEVIAISDAYGYFPHPDERMYGVTSDAFMKQAYCHDVETFNECAVTFARGADLGAVETALRAHWSTSAGIGIESGRALP